MSPTGKGWKSAFIAPARHCPHCVQRPLEPTSYAGHEVDVCPRCAGLWCERAAWDTETLGAYPAPGPSRLLTAALGDRPGLQTRPRPDRYCPNCDRPLTAIRVGTAEPCELDQCDLCGGVWFDHGEWDHLASLQTVRDHLQELDRPTTWGDWAFQFFLKLPVEFNVTPRRAPVVTITMIVLCLLTFLYQLAVSPAYWLDLATHANRIWRGQDLHALVTSAFLHGSWVHLLGNMYFLYILGDNVEDALGPWRYLLLYLGSAVAAGVMYAAIFPASDVPLLGASGAVFGVMAAYLLLYPTARLTIMVVFWQFKVTFPVWMGVYLIVQVVGAIQTLPGQYGGVAYWGHLGGFIAGLLFVLPQRPAIIRDHPLLRLLHR